MRQPFPTTLSREIFPLREVPNLSNIGHLALDRLERRGQIMMVGLRLADLDDVLKIAVTRPVREFCPKDATTKRFRNGPGWAEKGRGPFHQRSLETGELTGYSWAGFEHCTELPDHPVTSAFRSAVRGTGKAMVIATIEGSRALYNDEDGYGLETWESNTDAVPAYEAVGAVLQVRKVEEVNAAGETERITRPTLERGPDAFRQDDQWVRYDARLFYALPEPGEFKLPESNWQSIRA